MTLLCVSMVEKTTDSLLASMRALPRHVDMAEIRLDCMEEFDLERILATRTLPVIVTNRPVREGGGCTAPEAQRLDVLRTAARLGAEYVDVELDSAAALGALQGSARRIVSYHDFATTPPDPEAVFRQIRAAGADVVKLAVHAEDIVEVPAIIALLRKHAAEVPTIALSMGEAGVASRILAPKFGAFLTFASAGTGREAAPGQVNVDTMVDMYGFGRIDADTEVYGVVANPVAHSMSPAIHNAAFRAVGRNAVYLPMKTDDPAGLLAGFRNLGLRGLSVTIPHKQTTCSLMDSVDALSSAIGAVNTVLVREGRLLGRNTDVDAAVGAIESACRRAGMGGLAGLSVLQIGAGGAGRAIAFGLVARGARVVVANRTVSRARDLAAELGCRACGLDEMPDVEADVLVNATSIGMWPDVHATPAPHELLRTGMVVFDSVYNPVETRLLREAAAAGCTTATGLEWFVNQAVAQFEWWTDTPAPRQVMEEVVRDRLRAD